MSRHRWGLVVCFVGLWAVCGCQEAPPEGPDGVSFTGTVTLDGKPLDGAMVNFQAEGGKGAQNAIGITSESGEYELTTRVGQFEKSGVIPGTYRVQISRFVDPDGNPQDRTKPIEIPGRESLSKKYSDATGTVLKATVPDDGGTQDFALKGK